MNKRITGIAFQTILYILVFVISYFFFEYLPFDMWLNILIGDLVCTAFVFVFSLMLNNSSAYDPYWSVYPLIVVLYLSIKNGFNNYFLFFFIAITLWSFRLTCNFLYTFKSLKTEDWRYEMLRNKTKSLFVFVNFLGIHLFPTLIVYLCMLPFILATGEPNIYLLVTFFILSFIFVLIEGLSDLQMHKYRKNRLTTFNRNGLWKYSRHPNYFGEIMFWWMIFFMGLAFNNNVFTIIGAITNTLLFLFISIPLADERQSKKPNYLEYKKQTRMLLPIYKKQEIEEND